MAERRLPGRQCGINPLRRSMILAGIGILLLPATFQASAGPVPRLMSPASLNGKHLAIASALQGQTVQAELPMRGHGLHQDPRRPAEALIVARRPGTIAVKVNLVEGRVLRVWEAGEDRHFFGHACYSPDGRIVYLTENDVDTGEGLISVRDAESFKVMAEFSTHGIGPHELLLMSGGTTIAVANGGVLTHPETGRVKLNRGNIETSLAYIDRRDGKLLGLYSLASRDHSLRHLAVGADGTLAAALQYEGDRKGGGSKLLAFHRGGNVLQFAQAPQAEWNRMRHYGASVAWDVASRRFALTCPAGDVIACWSENAEYAGHIEVPGASGIAFAGGRGYASNESGDLFDIDAGRLSAKLISRFEGMKWDNHLYVQS